MILRAPDGCRGFDVDQVITQSAGVALVAAGYRFAIRYVGRFAQGSHDLTASERDVLHAAGLGLMVVQHVESETSWSPSEIKGGAYGDAAAEQCRAANVPCGTSTWLDLEGVTAGTDPAVVTAYCDAWFKAVDGAGYSAGLYVGWHCGLDPEQLYALPYKAYWSAYNLNRDEYPAKRGVQMRQATASPVGDLDIDQDVIQKDGMGDTPTIDIPDGWTP